MDFADLLKFDEFLVDLKATPTEAFLKGSSYLNALASGAGPLAHGRPLQQWLTKNWPLLKDRQALRSVDGNVKDAANSLQMALKDPEGFGQGIPLERWVQNLVDWMEKFVAEVNSFLEQMTEERFTYKGLRIANPERLPEPVVLKLLGAIDYVTALFKKRGVSSVLDNLLHSVTLVSQLPDAVGLYFPSNQSIHLSAEALDQRGKTLQNWVGEVFLHEVAHHVHMTLLDKQAKAEWDSSWEPIKLMRKEKDKVRNVTFADRTRFWDMLSAAKGDLRKLKLKGLDRMKLHAWLANPQIGGSLVTPKNLQWSKEGAWIKPFLDDPDKALFEDWDTPEGNKKRVDFRTRQLKNKLGVLPSDSDVNWPVLSMEQVAEYATEDHEIEKALEALETPTKYAQTNENEDFAESFVAFMDAPEKLSKQAKYRMQRALHMSGLAGKPIMKTVAKLVAEARALMAARLPTVVRSAPKPGGHPEARQVGDKILVFPKFFDLDDKQRVFVLLHELGHWFRQEHVKLADIMGFKPGEGFFDLFGAGNSEEGFADAFAVMIDDEVELKKRYPEPYQKLKSWLQGHDTKAFLRWAEDAAALQ